jgi:hypothetical protein
MTALGAKMRRGAVAIRPGLGIGTSLMKKQQAINVPVLSCNMDGGETIVIGAVDI